MTVAVDWDVGVHMEPLIVRAVYSSLGTVAFSGWPEQRTLSLQGYRPQWRLLCEARGSDSLPGPREAP